MKIHNEAIPHSCRYGKYLSFATLVTIITVLDPRLIQKSVQTREQNLFNAVRLRSVRMLAISDKAVCRTAPATPGVLKIKYIFYKIAKSNKNTLEPTKF